MKKRPVSIILAALLFAAFETHAADYYVAVNGSDTQTDAGPQPNGALHMAQPLESIIPAHGQTKWAGYHGAPCDRMHLTMTDVICDPAKTARAIEFRSVATGTFLGIAGITLLEIAP